MRRKTWIVLLLACVLSLALAFSASAQVTSDYTGWDTENDDTVYYMDGVMVQNSWVEIDGGKYYFGEDGAMYADGVYTIDGVLYGFDYNGQMFDDTYFEIYDETTGWWENYCALEGGALARNQWVWNNENEDGCWNYYADNGARVYNCVTTIGGKLYGFDYSGAMYFDTVFEVYNDETGEGDCYRAQGGAADGALLVNTWEQSYLEFDNESWYYYGADGKMYRDDIYKIGDDYYYFYNDGSLAKDGRFEIGYYDEELEEYVVLGIYCAKANGSLYMNSWFYEDGMWYYYGADGKAPLGLATIGGKQYCFNEWGMMVEDDVLTVLVDGVYKHYIVDENGTPVEAKNNDWTYAFGNWYLVLNNEFCQGRIYLVGDEYYAFRWNGVMFADEMFDLDQYDEETGEWLGCETYCAKADGTLARNEVVRASRYGYEDLYMFGEDCTTVNDYEGLRTLGDKTYYVFGDGNILSDCYSDTEDGVYRFDKDGAGTKLADGWYYDDTVEDYPDEWHWIYVQDGVMLIDGLYEIDGKRYAFDDSYGLITDDIYYDWQTEKYWLLTYMDKNGKGGAVCEEKNVWKTVNGEYVYLTEDSSLYEGWMNPYYLTPYMSRCEYIVDDDLYVYAVNQYGVSKKLTTTGTLAVNGVNAYLKNGKVVTGEWIKLSDGWRYFDDDGCMIVDDTKKIDDVWYCFDHNGRMCNNGWFRDAYGIWYWAAKSGALFTGIDSAGYVFTDSGRLVEDDVVCIDGVFYVVNRYGKKIGTFTEDGWNQVGGNWYYAMTYDYDVQQSREVLRGGYYDEFDRFFAFDQQGRMLANRFYDDGNYYLGSNGNALKGWFKVDGFWYYGDPDDYGYLYKGGIYTIGEKDFAFAEDGKLHVSKTFFYWDEDCIVTTNGNGEVTKKTAANGWVYAEDSKWGYGQAYYYKDGEPYTGWIGNYYIEYGWMAVNTVITDEETDKRYCIDKKGVKVTSKWYEVWEDEWVLARANGTLYYNEWVKSGGKWYYFEDVTMAYDCVITIDGKRHEFDKNGVWVGEYTEDNGLDFSGKKDGWVKHNGKWYFSMAGEPVRGESLLVDGKWYAFDYNGVMFANTFDFEYSGMSFGVYYYTAGGARGEYTGWKYIGKDWVYFNKANLACEGWILDGGKYYYQEFVLKETDYSYEPAGARMVTGYKVIDDTLYYFDKSGILTKTITTTGWYKGGSDWYYIDANGNAVAGETEYKIGGSRYAFDGDGKMVANAVVDNRYYNAHGALVTKSGWYAVNGEWIYVLSNGTVAYEGVFRIGGKDYYFYDSVWVG